MTEKTKLFRLTTVDLSLNKLIAGQLKFLKEYFDVTGVASDTGLMEGVAKREGVRVINVPMHREISLADDFKSLWNLYRLFRKEKPEILHCNTPKGSLLGLLAGKMAGVPNRIYTVTGLRYQGAHGLFRSLLMTMEKISCACATKVIPEGQGVLHTLHADGITDKPLAVLHHGNINGIDTEFFSRKGIAADMAAKGLVAVDGDDIADEARKNMRGALGFGDDDFVFVFVGRIVKDKGINELARVMRRLIEEERNKGGKCAKLLLVGSFDDDDPIDAENEQFLNNSPFVKCVGWQDDVRQYMLAADALVFPSYREGFPNAPMQAGALELPSIVTNINGCNEIIKDGLNGTIIFAPLTQNIKKEDPNDASVMRGPNHKNIEEVAGADARMSGPQKMQEALYSAMKWYVEHPEDVKRMAGNARSMIQERYEQREVWKALLEMYRSLKR